MRKLANAKTEMIRILELYNKDFTASTIQSYSYNHKHSWNKWENNLRIETEGIENNKNK